MFYTNTCSLSSREWAQALTAQGIAAGEIQEVIRAMRAGATYANVHTDLFPDGEIRGQIGPRRGGGDD